VEAVRAELQVGWCGFYCTMDFGISFLHFPEDKLIPFYTRT